MSATVPRQSHPAAIDPPSPGRVDGRPGCGVPFDERDEAVVLAPLGQLDRAGVERVRQAAQDLAERAVIIDLSDCVVTDANALADLTDNGADPADLCFVSRRPTCRLLLARTGVTSRYAVFSQVEDALQARTHSAAGYGGGWRRRP